MSFDKSNSQRMHSQHSGTRNLEANIDPYSPVIVEDLLHVIKSIHFLSTAFFFLPFLESSYHPQGINEWRNIQDIIRLTFKALTDVVRAQGETLRDLERQLPTKVIFF